MSSKNTYSHLVDKNLPKPHADNMFTNNTIMSTDSKDGLLAYLYYLMFGYDEAQGVLVKNVLPAPVEDIVPQIPTLHWEDKYAHKELAKMMEQNEEVIKLAKNELLEDDGQSFIEQPAIYPLGNVNPGFDTLSLKLAMMHQIEDEMYRIDASIPPPLFAGQSLTIILEEDDLRQSDGARITGNNEDNSMDEHNEIGTLANLVHGDNPTFTLDPLMLGTLPKDLTSDGIPVTFDIDGNKLIGHAGEEEILIFTLNPDGTFELLLLDHLDHPHHPGENFLYFPIGTVVKVSDNHGQSLYLTDNSIIIHHQDDAPILNEGEVNNSVEEDDLNNARSAGNNEDDSGGNRYFATGELNHLISKGADGGVFGWNNMPSTWEMTLTSNQRAIDYRAEGDTLYARAGSLYAIGISVVIDENGNVIGYNVVSVYYPGSTVFTLQINPQTGHYTFTLFDQLDHASGNGENNLLLQFGNLIKFTDSDGDSVTLNHDGHSMVNINVQDDIPLVIQSDPFVGRVEEDDLNNNQSVGNDEDHSTETNPPGNFTVSGELSPFVSAGTDESGTFAWSDLIPRNSSDPTFSPDSLPTSQGQLVDLRIEGNTLVGRAGSYTTAELQYIDGDGNLVSIPSEYIPGRKVFTIQLDENGQYTFTLIDQFDHPPGDGENELTLQFGQFATFTDADGDPVNLLFHPSEGQPYSIFNIVVVDDTPELNPNASPIQGSVQEDGMDSNFDPNDLSIGNKESEDTNNADDETSSLIAGSLTNLFKPGADEPLSFSLSPDNLGSMSTLYSKGELIQYQIIQLNPSTYELKGYIPENINLNVPERVVFELKVSVNGDWSFDLRDQLDHAPGQGENYSLITDPSTPALESSLVGAIDFSKLIVAVDADGDPAPELPNGSFSVKVQDDLPVITSFPQIHFVEEDDLTSSTNLSQGNDEDDSTNDPNGPHNVVTGKVTVSAGADEPVTFRLAGGGETPYTSNGQVIVENFSNGGHTLTGMVEATQDSPARVIYTMEVDNEGNYKFTLNDQMDHPLLPPGFDPENYLSLSFTIRVTDSDGDLTDTNAFVLVQDDVPVLTGQYENSMLQEDDLAPSNTNLSVGIDEDDSVINYETSGSLTHLVSTGADEQGHFGWTNNIPIQGDMTHGPIILTHVTQPLSSIVIP